MKLSTRARRGLLILLGFSLVAAGYAAGKPPVQPVEQDQSALVTSAYVPEVQEMERRQDFGPMPFVKDLEKADLDQGRRLFASACLPCHHNDAGGDGPNHDEFLPMPANLTIVRDTPDMALSIVKSGITGTQMPGHDQVSRADFNNVIGYVRNLPMDTEYQWNVPWELRGKQPPPGTGQTMYLTLCSGCHGTTGDGNGYWAQGDDHIWPKPADFRARSSELGRLYYIITAGIRGTFMPPFASELPTGVGNPEIPAEARWALAQYVQTFFQPGHTMTIRGGKMPLYRNPYFREDQHIVDLGRTLVDLYCAPCHGGEVNGTEIAPRLSDRVWRFGGGTDNAVFSIVSKGVPGQLMPAHDKEFSTEERWQAITYVRNRGGLPDPLTGETEKASPQPRVTIKGMSFVPNALVVDQGTTVTWTNSDETPHSVTADGWTSAPAATQREPKLWNSGPIAPGKSWSHRFDQVGTYMYHCDIHPYMRARVVVRVPPAGETPGGH